MYFCEICKNFFEAPGTDSETHPETDPATTETWICCPFCDDPQITEADRCPICGEYKDPREDYCEACKRSVHEEINTLVQYFTAISGNPRAAEDLIAWEIERRAE